MSGSKKVMQVPKMTLVEQKQAFKRQSAALGFDWARVDPALMFGACASALEHDVAVMLSRAAGGRGVCIRLMKGRTVPAEVEYAFDAEELNGWLEAIVNTYGSTSEDTVTTLRAQMETLRSSKRRPTDAMSAD